MVLRHMENKQVHVFLNMPHSQTAMDMRMEHIARTLNKDLNDIRIYTCGSDFFKNDIPEGRSLPYGSINGKIKSDDNFFKEIVGEKLED